MHPVVILIPVAALLFGPRLWVKRILKQHNRKEEKNFPSGGELAKELLARHQLHEVQVESSDVGDHYDPKTKTVRLTRDKLERKTLTAITTAAHEVAHAVQDATRYGPFVWRMRLITLAQVTGQVSAVILIGSPALSRFTPYRIPPALVGSAALAMLGTGMAAQLIALPTELNASFTRALPSLRDGYITEKQAKDAKTILVAGSLTYVASSFLSVLALWPWLGWQRSIRLTEHHPGNLLQPDTKTDTEIKQAASATRTAVAHSTQYRESRKPRRLEGLTRQIGKPLIRAWFRLQRTL